MRQSCPSTKAIEKREHLRSSSSPGLSENQIEMNFAEQALLHGRSAGDADAAEVALIGEALKLTVVTPTSCVND